MKKLMTMISLLASIPVLGVSIQNSDAGSPLKFNDKRLEAHEKAELPGATEIKISRPDKAKREVRLFLTNPGAISLVQVYTVSSLENRKADLVGVRVWDHRDRRMGRDRILDLNWQESGNTEKNKARI